MNKQEETNMKTKPVKPKTRTITEGFASHPKPRNKTWATLTNVTRYRHEWETHATVKWFMGLVSGAGIMLMLICHNTNQPELGILCAATVLINSGVTIFLKKPQI
jgi:hypothetical protein